MKIELSRDELDVVIDAIGNNIEHYEGRGIQVPEMHQLWADLDSYRQVQSVEQIREEQREKMEQIRQLSAQYLGGEQEQKEEQREEALSDFGAEVASGEMTAEEAIAHVAKCEKAEEERRYGTWSGKYRVDFIKEEEQGIGMEL